MTWQTLKFQGGNPKIILFLEYCAKVYLNRSIVKSTHIFWPYQCNNMINIVF